MTSFRKCYKLSCKSFLKPSKCKTMSVHKKIHSSCNKGVTVEFWFTRFTTIWRKNSMIFLNRVSRQVLDMYLDLGLKKSNCEINRESSTKLLSHQFDDFFVISCLTNLSKTMHEKFVMFLHRYPFTMTMFSFRRKYRESLFTFNLAVHISEISPNFGESLKIW